MRLLRSKLLPSCCDGVVLVENDVAVMQTNLKQDQQAQEVGSDTHKTHRNTKLAQHFVLRECKLGQLALWQHKRAGALEARTRVIGKGPCFTVLGDLLGAFVGEKKQAIRSNVF